MISFILLVGDLGRYTARDQSKAVGQSRLMTTHTRAITHRSRHVDVDYFIQFFSLSFSFFLQSNFSLFLSLFLKSKLVKKKASSIGMVCILTISTKKRENKLNSRVEPVGWPAAYFHLKSIKPSTSVFFLPRFPSLLSHRVQPGLHEFLFLIRASNDC